MYFDVLPEKFYKNQTLDVAKNLLGKYLVHNTSKGLIAGKIVETEAYIGPYDKAAHSYNNKRTSRNEIMYGPPGFAYIYLIYGMYYCFNIVTGEIGKPEAVLIRALEPAEGLDTMAYNRFQKSYSQLSLSQKNNLTNGPGKLCTALQINKSNYGDSLMGKKLFIAFGENIESSMILSSPRINVDYAEEAKYYPWRFYVKDNPYVSHTKIIK